MTKRIETTPTYTIATGAEMLLAVVPYGEDIHTAVRDMAEDTGLELSTAYTVHHVVEVDSDLDDDDEPIEMAWRERRGGYALVASETRTGWLSGHEYDREFTVA
jgi:hypothetical protein